MSSKDSETKQCHCPYCDVVTSSELPFCGDCGKAFQYCKQCGAVLPTGEQKCYQCGAEQSKLV